MQERLSANIEGKFWKGPDIEISEEVTFPCLSYQSAPVIIHPQDLPSLYGCHPEALQYVRASTRSRYTQLGLDVYEAVTEQVCRRILDGNIQNMWGNILRPFTVEALVFNRSARPVYLPKGSRLFRFYSFIGVKRMQGKELVSIVKRGGIKIDGEFGTDWMWGYAKKGERDERIVGINVRIKDENRKWIPPDSSNTPLSISDSGNYREELDRFLEPIPETKKEILWVGETPKIMIEDGLNAIISKAVVPDIKAESNFLYDGWGLHINSHLIDGGKTNWPLRVEVVSPTLRGKIPNFVLLDFFS